MLRKLKTAIGASKSDCACQAGHIRQVTGRPYDYLLKIVLMGQYRAGRTSLLVRFIDDAFHEDAFSCALLPTGIDFRIHSILLDDNRVKLQLWDTYYLNPRFSPSSLRGASGVMIVFSTTNRDSFDATDEWFKQCELLNHRSNVHPDMPYLLVGTKSDCASEREIDYETAKAYADQHGFTYIETSSKTGENVDIAFLTLIAKVFKKQEVLDDLDKCKVYV